MPVNDGNIVKRTTQYIDNQSFDEETLLPMVELAGTDGSAVYRLKVNSDGSINVATSGGATNYDVKIQAHSSTAGIYYVGKAPIDADPALAVWQVKRLDSSTIALDKKWAGDGTTAGSGLFNQVWNNRESLTYS